MAPLLVLVVSCVLLYPSLAAPPNQGKPGTWDWDRDPEAQEFFKRMEEQRKERMKNLDRPDFGGGPSPRFSPSKGRDRSPYTGYGGPDREREDRDRSPYTGYGGPVREREDGDRSPYTGYGGPVREREDRDRSSYTEYARSFRGREDSDRSPYTGYGGPVREKDSRRGYDHPAYPDPNAYGNVEDEGRHFDPSKEDLNEWLNNDFNKRNRQKFDDYIKNLERSHT